jgi:hypothetical protein
MSSPDLPQLEPVRNDGIRAVQVGLGLFAVAGLVLLVERGALADRGTQWWVAVCGAGLLIGVVELAIFSRRRVLIRARERGALGVPTDVDGSGPGNAGQAAAGPTG